MKALRNKILLNYIYLGKEHAGGKDQFALNLLCGIYENGDIDRVVVACYDYLQDTIRKIAPEAEVISLRSGASNLELARMIRIQMTNTFTIPKIIREYGIREVFHASCNNGLKKYQVPSVVIPHDIKAISHRVMGSVKVPWYKYIMYKFMYGVDFKNADKIIAISNNDMKEMHKYYPKYKDKIVQIYNPIKVEKPDIVWQGMNKHNDIVAINLQFHHKNIITLIKAFEKVKDNIDCDLVLVGNVPDRVAYLKKYVHEHKLEDRVIFTGFVTSKEKRQILIDSSLYVNPSLFEGFGMTAVEAMILKVPTLLSNESANYEVTGGMCRYYEPADDVNALAEAIVSCIDNPKTGQELEEARTMMMDRYSYRKIARQYIDLFEKELNNEA